jgi:hypothetical protein
MTKKRPVKSKKKVTTKRKKVAKKGKGKPRRVGRVTPKRATGIGADGPAVAGGIDLITAGEIVQNAIPGGPHDIDITLEDAGLISPGQRTVFRSDVVNDVAAHGATIAAADVPNNATTTLRQARTAVQQNAH